MRSRNQRRGNALIEFTLVGIPVLFALISIFEMARGMWVYTSLAHATKDAVRFAIVHGANCSVNGNACTTSVAQVVERFRQQGGGFAPDQLELTLRAGCRADRKYDQAACSTDKRGTLQALLTDGAVWPDQADPGFDAIEIHATYPFQTVMGMVWPGAGSVSMIGTYDLQAVSRETVQF